MHETNTHARELMNSQLCSIPLPTRVSPLNPARYAHLAAFVREAPETQVRAFGAAVGSAMLARMAEVGDKPIWLSTSGLGVAWLHARLYSRPKYYTHGPYKT